jgi:hypothetical protein
MGIVGFMDSGKEVKNEGAGIWDMEEGDVFRGETM